MSPAASPGVAPVPSVATSPVAQAPLTPVRFGISSNAPSFIFLYVARDTGIFQAHGLDASITQINPTAADAALVSGELDFVANIPNVIQGTEHGLPLRVVVVTSELSNQLLIGGKGMQSVADLRGQVIAGSTPGSEPNEVTAQILQLHGLDADSYSVLNGGNSDDARAAMVSSGNAQAALLGLQAAIELLDRGYPLLDNATEFKTFGGGLGTSDATIQQHRDLVQRTVSSILEALQVCATQGDVMRSVLANEYGFSPQDADRAYSLLADRWQTTGRPDDDAIQAQLQLDVEGQQLDHTPDPNDIFDFSFLPPAAGS